MTKITNVLVIGGNSFLGKNILKQLRKNMGFNVQFTSRAPSSDGSALFLDLSLENDYLPLLKEKYFDVILWVAGIKDVKWCEANQTLAKKINYDSLVDCYGQIQSLPEKMRPKVIFISSDYVFDGLVGQYQPQSEKNPKTYYGRLKSMAEDFLMRQQGQDVAVRTSSLCGQGGVFFNWLLSELSQPKKLSLFANSFLTPTSVGYFSRVIEDLILEVVSGRRGNKILHICGDLRYSRVELAIKLKSSFPTELIAEVRGEDAAGHLSQDLSLVSSYGGSQGPHSYNDLVKEAQECIK